MWFKGLSRYDSSYSLRNDLRPSDRSNYHRYAHGCSRHIALRPLHLCHKIPFFVRNALLHPNCHAGKIMNVISTYFHLTTSIEPATNRRLRSTATWMQIILRSMGTCPVQAAIFSATNYVGRHLILRIGRMTLLLRFTILS